MAELPAIKVAFVNTEQKPLYTRHICFKVTAIKEAVALVEVYREYFPHPDGPELGSVSVVTTRIVHTYNRTDPNSAAIVLLEAAQNNSMNLYENTIKGLLPGVEHSLDNRNL